MFMFPIEYFIGLILIGSEVIIFFLNKTKYEISYSDLDDDENTDITLKKVSNLEEYDTICLAFPIWWYKEPTIIDKFLEENDMSNKNIYVFVTSGSSSIDSTYKSLKSNFPNLNFVDGKRFTGRESDEEYRNWMLK